MITIKINEKQSGYDFIHPYEMLNSEYGTVFEQWFEGKPQGEFYISCGHCEDSVINIWYDEEDGCHKLSTDNAKSLKGLVNSVMVRKIDATVTIGLMTKE